MVHRLVHYFKRKNRMEANIKHEEEPNRDTQYESDDRGFVVTHNAKNSTVVGTRTLSTIIEEAHKISTASAFESNSPLSIYNPILSQNRKYPHDFTVFIGNADLRNMELIAQNVISTSGKRKKCKLPQTTTTHEDTENQKQTLNIFQLPIRGNCKHQNEVRTYKSNCNPSISKRKIDLRNSTNNTGIMPPTFSNHVDKTKITTAQNYFQLLQDREIIEIRQRRNLLQSLRTPRENQEVYGPDQGVHNDFRVQNSPAFMTRAHSRSDAFLTPSCTSRPSFQTLKTHNDDLHSHQWKRKRIEERPSLLVDSTIIDIGRVDLEYEDDAFEFLRSSLGETRAGIDHAKSITVDATMINSSTTPSSTSSYEIEDRQGKEGELFSTPFFDTEDEIVLTDYQCELRKHLEMFEASVDDVKVSASPGRCGQIVPGQIGIRCAFCAKSGPLAGRNKGAVNFSKTIEGMYQVAQNMAKAHLSGNCCMIPLEVKQRLGRLRQDSRRAKGGKEYWARSIRRLGIGLSEDNVMRVVRRNRHDLGDL